MSWKTLLAMSALLLGACHDDAPDMDAGGGVDAGPADAGGADSGRPDVDAGGGPTDAAVDAQAEVDAGGDQDASGPPGFGGAIGVVGCSNTNQAATGYLEVSTVDSLINAAQGGQAMREWTVATGGPWDRYDRLRPPGGYSAVWLNLCQRAADGLDQTVVDAVMANIRSRDPSAPIVISPLNFYEEETCGVTNGNQIPNAGAALADSTAMSDPTVFRGPDLGPFAPAMLRMDNCHLNAAGITRAGQQLVAFFDM